MTEKKPRPRGQFKDLGGGKFRIAVPLGEGPKGERPYHHETLYNSTPAKVRKRINSILASVDDGTYFLPGRMLMKDATSEWLERKFRKVSAGELKLSTYETYKMFTETHIDGQLGEVKLRCLNVKMLQEFFDTLQDKGMQPSTMRLVYTSLKQTFDLQVRYGRMKENLARLVELPKKNDPKKAKVLDEKGVFKFIKAAAEVPEDFIFLFALVTGMRPCEFIGLRYKYLELMVEDNMERGFCRVLETIVRRRAGGWYFSEPKTEKGKRPIYFPAFMYHALMARRDSHLENLARLGKTHELVFTNQRGEPLDRDILGRGQFKRLLDRAGLPRAGHTLYSLRRSAATLSMLLGDSPKELSDKLGHASVEFTQNEYVDVLPVMRRMRSDRLENFLFSTNFAQHGADGVM